MTNVNSALIPITSLKGMNVYNRSNELLGTIDDVVIERTSGRVIYVVMVFGGGLLGFGRRWHPVPWELFALDAQKPGYIIDVDKTRFTNAPHYGTNFEWTPDYGVGVNDYYGTLRPVPVTV